MNEKTISECTQFLINNNINPFKISEWQELIKQDSMDIESYEKLLLYFAMNLNENVAHYSYKNGYPQFLSEIRDEIYKKLMDQNLRGKIDLFTQFGSVFVAEKLSNIIIEDSDVLPAFIAFILIEISKIGIDAWCKFYEKTVVSEENES